MPEDPDLAVGLGHVLHQPLDRVVGICRVVDRRPVLRPAQRPVHHVVPFRLVLAAHVLDHADVPALDDHVGHVVVSLQHGSQVRALAVRRELVGAVRRASEQDGRSPGPLRHQDDRVELDPVAHADHRRALHVVERIGHRTEPGRHLAGQGRVGCRSGRSGWRLRCRLPPRRSDPENRDQPGELRDAFHAPQNSPGARSGRLRAALQGRGGSGGGMPSISTGG